MIPHGMRVGLVLGAGGVQGGAWLTGALAALAEETGWDPASADYIVGTSAGSMLGSLLAAGLPPVVHGRPLRRRDVRGDRGRARARRPPTADRSGGAIFKLERGALPIFPGSLPLALRSLIRPHRHTAGERDQRLGAARHDLERAAAEDHPQRRSRRVDEAPEPLGRRLRLRDRTPGLLRPGRRASRPARGRGRRLVLDPRLLPAGADRRPVLRRRRDPLPLEPRRPARTGARPRDLPEPHLQPPPGPGARPGSRRSASSSTGQRQAARFGGEAAPRRGHRGRPDPADAAATWRRWA